MNLYTCKYFYPNLIIVIITLFMIVLGIIYVTKKELKKGLFFLIAGIAFLLLYLCSYFDYYHNVYMLKKLRQIADHRGEFDKFDYHRFWGNAIRYFYYQ